MDRAEYEKQRAELVAREAALSWDFICKREASSAEEKANRILQALRMLDNEEVYAKAPSRRGFRGQEHPRFMGDHFLYNVDLINETKLFSVAKKMPKGAHLHIHFNANLLPGFLIDIAKRMERMSITSNIPLVTVGRDESEPGYYDNFNRSKIQFSMLSNKHKKATANLFDRNYPVDERQPMSFQKFLGEFGKHYTKCTVDQWLIDKLVFHEEEAHGWLQTAQGAWDQFNARTQMMKGLFNYETAFREYTRRCLQEFVDDNIQYAEIRPNFMKDNNLWKDDGSETISNSGIMDIIIQECNQFQEKIKKGTNPYFAGIKVIYCTPRSFRPKQVQESLEECLKFKKDERYSKWIAGFDLVGEESKGEPIRTFLEELVAFKKDCKAAGVEIPFLFHCGETLDIGNDTDGNLYDALLLKAKRIGHGFALARHPYLMEQVKKHNVCLELCPISNEILGLTPRVNGHAMYNLLANNVHCTVNTDNGTLFKSQLSHDFYQVFAGKTDMTLYGWKQLAEWSIEHSCMDAEERRECMTHWKKRWDDFCLEVIKDYGYLIGLPGPETKA
ncbi:Metallo-dependent hydrolase [Coniochaeta ligniaria NRRL 30616]|uniref:adenosine deaminase n=1 Tax=Coniochaeta ligniaria NRRL 30616 TaxID=1408157 RepID=A0A1J7IC82_9PEZI|nr:Metallo-dependent hydrolase [Coniochaeta ligniaria NRRL 30616]